MSWSEGQTLMIDQGRAEDQADSTMFRHSLVHGCELKLQVKGLNGLEV